MQANGNDLTFLWNDMTWNDEAGRLFSRFITTSFCLMALLNSKQSNSFLPWNSFTTHFVFRLVPIDWDCSRILSRSFSTKKRAFLSTPWFSVLFSTSARLCSASSFAKSGEILPVLSIPSAISQRAHSKLFVCLHHLPPAYMKEVVNSYETATHMSYKKQKKGCPYLGFSALCKIFYAPVLTSSSPLATYLSLNSRIPCSECFETGSGGVSLVWQITFCNNFTANRRKTTFHNWKEETVWSNSCCNFHIFLLPFFGSEEIISFKSRIFIHIISSNPMLSLQFKERYRYPTSLLRFAKQPSHWTAEIMCVQVSSNLLEGIYVPVKSKLKPPPGMPRAFDVCSCPEGRAFDHHS